MRGALYEMRDLPTLVRERSKARESRPRETPPHPPSAPSPPARNRWGRRTLDWRYSRERTARTTPHRPKFRNQQGADNSTQRVRNAGSHVTGCRRRCTSVCEIGPRAAAQPTTDNACCARECARSMQIYFTTGTPAASLLNAGRSVSQIAFNFASSMLIFATSSSRTAICCEVGA